MTSTYILIIATLLLGGLIALLGDRIGTKVGKARLRLFNFRPRQTATMITIVAGTLISASTLGILLLLSESLRDGLFELDEIKKELRQVKGDLNQANDAKKQVATQLTTVKREQLEAEEQLQATQKDFQLSTQQLKAISQQASTLRRELNALLGERAKQVKQLTGLKQQSEQLQIQLQEREQKIQLQDRAISAKESSIQTLRAKQQVLQSEIGNRDRHIATLDTAIADKNNELEARTNRLNDLESQLEFLQREVAVLEQYYQTYQELRERRIAIFKGEVLASATIRIVDTKAAIPAIDRLLGQANRSAIKSTLLNSDRFNNQRVVRITTAEVKQLAEQIQDGQDYVVRILSAGNYVQGEQEVRVFTDIAVNREIFQAGESIATVSIDGQEMSHTEIQERLDWLLAASKFRAQRAGIIGDLQVGDGQIATIIKFIDEISQSPENLGEIKAVVAENTYTAGPLKLNLVVVKDGVIVLST
jgi:uncharacterized protein (DUF3084 family)